MLPVAGIYSFNSYYEIVFMKSLIVMFGLLFSVNVYAEVTAGHGDVIMTMDNFHSDEGVVRIALFSTSDGFPDKPEKAIKIIDAEIHSGKLTTAFKHIPYGVYAISVLHDENASGDMDTNWLGIPQEGYGVSNDATASFGPPEFDDARFVLESEILPMHMTIQY